MHDSLLGRLPTRSQYTSPGQRSIYPISCLLVVALLMGLSSCKKPTPDTKVDEQFGAYISAHSMGSISSGDELFIKLAKRFDESLVGTKLADGILTISPRIKGETYWQDASTLAFKPEDRWNYDETYAISLDLKKIFGDIQLDRTNPEFRIHIKPLVLSINIQPVTYDGPNVSLYGNIRSTEDTDDAVIETLLSASQKRNKNLQIAWEHYSLTNHRFVVSGISRTDELSTVKIAWEGKGLDKSFGDVKVIKVLPKQTFSIIDVATVSGANSINITLSDAVSESQKLDGLIRIDGLDGKYRYDKNGNVVTVHPPGGASNPFSILVDQSLQRYDGKTLGKDYSLSLSFEPTLPKLKLSGKGVIVPNSDEVIFPFEAQNLNGVTVEVFKIFQDNVLQFLQYQDLDNEYGHEPVGRIIHQQHVDLAAINAEDNANDMVRYALDLSKIIRLDPGALYQIRIGFSMADVADYPCEEERRVAAAVLAGRDGFTSIMEENYQNYNYSDRENPCKNSYYWPDHFIRRNVLASNFGIISKMDDNQTALTTVTDLRDVSPMSGATLEYYDFQQQLISTAATDAKGIAKTKLERNPAFLIVKQAGTYGYLSLQDRNANSLSDYEVSGARKSDGIDGFIYGERGVWRPGDTMFLNFMLEDKLHQLPTEHPVSIEVDDARGKNRFKKNTSYHVGGIYHFAVPTDQDAVTGNWRATVTVGGTKFRQTLKVETVKPNRLKVDFDKERLDLSTKENITLTSKWLHGAPAADLTAKVDMSLRALHTSFDGYGSYDFDDPARKLESYPFQIFEGKLGADGAAQINIEKNKSWLPAGKLTARLETKVFEKGGNFSTDTYTVPVDFYDSYVGLKIPENRWGSRYIDQQNPQPIQIILLDKNGNPLKNKQLTIGLYTAQWNWWYDRSYNGRYQYNSTSHLGAKAKQTVTTDSQGKTIYKPELAGYGNYMVRVCDDESGHCTGGMFYTGSYYRGSNDQEGPSQLLFSTDKKNYNTNEDINVTIPSTAESKIFISIENGTQVLQAFWVDGQAASTKLSIPTTKEMNSNIYIHAHLVQPHNNGTNDLPLRMYGVVPVSVVDSKSTLGPVIDMNQELEPNETYTVTISEQAGKEMYYTLAVVDEGLLSLTRFQTPQPWDHFYGKQALGVKTWDMYDYVLDGYGGAVDQYISIGGDAGEIARDNAEQVNRFVPVVEHLGPFKLTAKQKAKHQITMPNYVGAVRVMVVARKADTYGNTEQSVPVKKPLMVQTTLPRVLGPNETLSVPANIWAMDDKVKNVSVQLSASDNISLTSASNQSLSFAQQGDQLAYFDIAVGTKTGAAKFKTIAKSGSEQATEEIDIAIRNPNPYTTEVLSKILQPGDTWIESYKTFGSPGTNEAILEVSNLPPVNFGRRLQYLIRYPYGCVEQTTSSVFPQLYLSNIADLDANNQLQTEKNIVAGINRLILFQRSDGGFSYWQGGNYTSDWGTSYAGHFLLEAKEKGFAVPSQVIKDFIKYQNKISNTGAEGLAQAYRLYTLAKAGEPNIGAMNRLRNSKNMTETGAYLLGAAYAHIGQNKAAEQLIYGVSTSIEAYTETGNTYGSEVRDMAIIAMAMHKMGKQEDALSMISEISKKLSGNLWYSTHSTSFGLLAVGQVYGQYDKDDLKFSYTLAGNEKAVQTKKSLFQKPVDMNTSSTGTVTVKNTSNTVQFAKFVVSGQRPPGENTSAKSKHITLQLQYLDSDGKSIDPAAIKQGTDFEVIATVTNLGTRTYTVEEVALSQIFPSGWEIQNERITNGQSSNTGLEYQNIRDDRVYSFFDLKKGKPLTIKLKMTAAYAGRFYMPPTAVEAMYDNEIQATSEGLWVEVTRL